MEGHRSLIAPAGEAAAAVAFVLPGFLHLLANSLFSLRGHAEMLRPAPAELLRGRGAILRVGSKAEQALDVMRLLAGEPTARPTQAGILLHRLGELLRLPLRDHGLAIRVSGSSRETPAFADGTALCRVVVEAVRCAIPRLPACFQGTVALDLAHQDAAELLITLAIESDPRQLPFPCDLAPVLTDAEPVLAAYCERAEAIESRLLHLVLPVQGA